jgi:hypothetical protein
MMKRKFPEAAKQSNASTIIKLVSTFSWPTELGAMIERSDEMDGG